MSEDNKNLDNPSSVLHAMLEELSTKDAEIRKKLLGYVQWFAPISKESLERLLLEEQYEQNLITNNLNYLVILNLLIDTGNNLIPNKQHKEINKQALTYTMPEILKRLGFSC